MDVLCVLRGQFAPLADGWAGSGQRAKVEIDARRRMWSAHSALASRR